MRTRKQDQGFWQGQLKARPAGFPVPRAWRRSQLCCGTCRPGVCGRMAFCLSICSAFPLPCLFRLLPGTVETLRPTAASASPRVSGADSRGRRRLRRQVRSLPRRGAARPSARAPLPRTSCGGVPAGVNTALRLVEEVLSSASLVRRLEVFRNGSDGIPFCLEAGFATCRSRLWSVLPRLLEQAADEHAGRIQIYGLRLAGGRYVDGRRGMGSHRLAPRRRSAKAASTGSPARSPMLRTATGTAVSADPMHDRWCSECFRTRFRWFRPILGKDIDMMRTKWWRVVVPPAALALLGASEVALIPSAATSAVQTQDTDESFTVYPTGFDELGVRDAKGNIR